MQRSLFDSARGLVPAFLFVLTGCLAATQQAPQHFLEPFDVGLVPHDTSLLYEADVAPHLFLYDGLRGAYNEISQDNVRTNSARAFRVILSPMFVIRQLHDSSAAVRTPSFMPRVSVELVRASRRGKVTAEPDIQFPAVQLVAARLSLAHHSNGQAGCFRTGFVPIDVRSNDSVWDRTTDTTIVRLNRANGDFSSTYFEGLVYGWWMSRGSSQISTLGGGLAFALDVYPNHIFGALSPEQAALYGKWRFRTSTEGNWRPQAGIACSDRGAHSTWCFLAGAFSTRAEYVRAPVMTTPLAKRLETPLIPYRLALELSYSVNALLGSGPFIRWENGQDYYNIGFVNRRRELFWGLTVAPGGPDRVAKKSALP
jgi:hypothetical protein